VCRNSGRMRNHVGESLIGLWFCCSYTLAALCGVDMCIECCFNRRTSAESCLGFVLLTRGGLGRGRDCSFWGERTSAGTRILREHTPSEGRLERGEFMVIPKGGLERSASYDPLSSGDVP
jgi:hypothetical protein